jgi:N-formylglutamate deformylase
MKPDSRLRFHDLPVQGNSQDRLPPWAVLHVPHDSIVIPAEIRPQFLLDDGMLALELQRMTDHATLRLFGPLAWDDNLICSPVSRLVVDVERFADDAGESMAARGMGAVYMRTSDGAALRHPLSEESRASLMDAHYFPHHARLEARTMSRLRDYCHVLILDCHSFSSKPLPHEDDQELPRPEICIGTDPFHTPSMLETELVRAFRDAGFQTMVNRPFSGAMVPAALYQSDRRAAAVMVEVNRRLYMDEAKQCLHPDFERIARTIRFTCKQGIDNWFQKARWTL